MGLSAHAVLLSRFCFCHGFALSQKQSIKTLLIGKRVSFNRLVMRSVLLLGLTLHGLKLAETITKDQHHFFSPANYKSLQSSA
ncbi:hypothetical protein [Bartonella jaculi]|uniref:hypothetical protein n=1 Tax=Bartonella jaculi TaxID=686226 RepID=UPI0031EDA742